jgi:hypothetical protein
MGMICIVPYQLLAHHVCAPKLIFRTARRILFRAHFYFPKKITTIDRPDVVAKLLRDMC